MRLLAVWELGAGQGHLQTLAPVLRSLAAGGHRVGLAARDPALAARILADDKVKVRRAPKLPRKRSILPPATCYAELLLRIGYLEPERILRLVRGWLSVIEQARPQAILAEHSPTALIAARVHGTPALTLGTGFTLPPQSSTAFQLPRRKTVPETRLAAAEQRVLKTINRILEQFGQRTLSGLPALFPPDRSFLCTFPELDHHGPRAGVRYWGPVGPPPGAVDPPQWPGGRGRPVFVYLPYGYPQFAGLMNELRALGCPALVASLDIPQSLSARLEGPSLKLVPRPLDLMQVAAEEPIVFTHAGHGTTARMLLSGMPVILLPNHVEQTSLAFRVAGQGLGLMASPDPRTHRYASMRERLEASPRCRENARAFARKYRAFDPQRQLEEMVGAILKRLAKVA